MPTYDRHEERQESARDFSGTDHMSLIQGLRELGYFRTDSNQSQSNTKPDEPKALDFSTSKLPGFDEKIEDMFIGRSIMMKDSPDRIKDTSSD